MPDDIFSSRLGCTGWVPDESDDNDYLFIPTFRVPWGTEVNLRTTVELKDYFNDVYDQRQTGSCVANAVAANYGFELNRSTNVQTNSDNFFPPSRSFIYYNTRMGRKEDAEDDEQELVADKGSQIRLAMRSLQKFGVCKDATWPLREGTLKWWPGPYPYFEAQSNWVRAYQYKRLDVKRGDHNRSQLVNSNDVGTMDTDGDKVLYNLRSCITQENPVVLGFYYNRPMPMQEVEHSDNLSFTKWRLADVPLERRHFGPAPNATKKRGVHAVLAIGFTDRKKKERGGFVLCQNSWGSDEERPGRPYFWMPYNWITDFSATMDFWMMDLSDCQEASSERGTSCITFSLRISVPDRSPVVVNRQFAGKGMSC